MFRILLLAIALCFVASCAPRGETKSLDEILKLSKYRFEEALRKSALEPETEELLKNAENHLVALEERSTESQDRGSYLSSARAMDATLRELLPRVGYTTRPAFSEIVSQYSSLGFAEKDRPRLTSVDTDVVPDVV